MTTSIVKTLNPNGSGANNFATAAEAFAFIRSANCITDDFKATILDYIGVSWPQDLGTLESDDTRRITWRPAAGLGTNDINTSGFNTASTGITMQWPRAEYDLNIRPGVDFDNLNIDVLETGRTNCISFRGSRPNNSFENVISNCRIMDRSTSGGFLMRPGNDYNRLLIRDSLIVSERGQRIIQTPSGDFRMKRCTVVSRNVVQNTDAITCEYGGGQVEDTLFIGFATPVNGLTATNCASNKTGAGAGFIINTTANALVVNEASDYTPTANGPLIAAASANAVGTLDILGGNRGPNPDIGARQRTAFAPKPTGIITEVTATKNNGTFNVTVKFSTTNTPTSALVSLVPVSVAGNNAVGQGPVSATLSPGSGIATFSNVKVGRYSETVTVTNAGGTGSATGAIVLDVVDATGTVATESQIAGAQAKTVTGTTTGAPTAGTITWLADSTVAGSIDQGPFPLTLSANAFSDTNRPLAPGAYKGWSLAFTTAAGTSMPFTGGTAFAITPLTGSVQTPSGDSTPTSKVTGITVSPTSATVEGGSTRQFTAAVQGTNNPSQAVTWVKISGAGTILDGLVTAPAVTTSDQVSVFRATSAQDTAYSVDFTVTTPAGASDTTNPQLTGTLQLSSVTSTGFTVTSPIATDNIAVAGYRISTDGGATWSATQPSPVFAVTGKLAATTYSVRVVAVDTSGNLSSPPLATQATTAPSVRPPARTVTIDLSLALGVPAAALGSLRWAWFDQPKVNDWLAPTDQGAVATSSVAGTVILSLFNSVLTSGQTGSVLITNSDGTTTMEHRAFFSPWKVD